MVDFIDYQYATNLSGRLERFKIHSSSPCRINFRCPICGDSKKSQIKARGWIIEDPKKGSIHYFCHNCGTSLSFSSFLQTIDPVAHKLYIAAKYLEKARNTTPHTSTAYDEDSNADSFKTNTSRIIEDPLRKLKKVSQLKPDHPIKQYINKRQIPSNHHYRMFYAPKFMQWINSVVPGKFPNVTRDHPRLVFPFLDKKGKCFGVTGRGFDPDGMRYMTIMFEPKPKIFGLDKVDFDKPYLIVEGAIDSMFLSNAVAMAGADGNFDGLEKLDNAVFVFDNEQRNLQIHSRIEKLIDKGLSVCIWPSYIQQKDINDMVLSGITNVEQVIYANTYKGLNAKLNLSEWRKT